MFRIGICEDDKYFSSQLEKIITIKFFQNNIDCIVECYNSGEDLLNEISNRDDRYDIIFFDIDLPGLNGIETARKIREKDSNCLLIFVTSLNEKVYEALDLTIFHFIRKNHFQKEVDQVLDSLINKLDYLLEKYLFSVGNENIYLQIQDIIYLEVSNRHVIIHTAEKEYISNYRTLKEIPFNLMDNHFFEIYRGVVINLNHVEDLVDDKVITSHKKTLYIARRRLSDFKEEFYKYIAMRR